MTSAVLTEDEKRAIAALQRLAKKWPDSLWLFAASNSLCVMKKDEQGNRVLSSSQGFEPENCVTTIAIESDGGDW